MGFALLSIFGLESPFAETQSFTEGALAEQDVVVLRASKVVKGKAVMLWSNNAPSVKD